MVRKGGLDTVHLKAGRAQRVCKSLSLILVQHRELIMVPGDQGTAAVEIAALGDPPIPNPGEPGGEEWRFSIGTGIQDRVQIPVGGAAEGDAFPLSIND